MKKLTNEQKELLLKTLEQRFTENMHRHETLKWQDIIKKLSDDHLKTLYFMEDTKGEPDVLYDARLNEWYFVDFSKETPAGRRSLCYDFEAWEGRTKNKPQSDVETEANRIGGELLDEETYRYLQTIEPLDLKTSSWIATPKKIRVLKGALFCDRRYNTVFTYHNGADSYYGSRGFRLKLLVHHD